MALPGPAPAGTAGDVSHEVSILRLHLLRVMFLVFAAGGTFVHPQWWAGRASPQLNEDLLLIGGGPAVFGLIIPWGYVYRKYIRQPAERWR